MEFALASLLCTAGRYDEAQRAFGKVDYATLSPEHRQQYDIRMGYIRFQQGDYDDALRYFRRIPSPGEYSDHALYYISYIAYVRGDNATARAGFTELSRSAAYGAVAPFYLLQIEFNEGNYRYVVTTGGSLIDRAAGERRTELERIVAEGWFHLGDYGRTEEFLDAYRRSGGEMGRNENYLLGYSLYRQARYDEARPCLQQVCGADDALTQNASYHLADCYLRGGDKQRAMQSFAMAANEAFDAAIAEDALFNYGKLQYELGGGLFNEAIHVLNRYIAQYPTSERAVQARELLIAAYYNSRNYEAAYTALKHYPSPDGNLRAALQKIAYFRGLEAYSRGDLDGAAVLTNLCNGAYGVGRDQRQPQVRGAGPVLAGRDRLRTRRLRRGRTPLQGVSAPCASHRGRIRQGALQLGLLLFRSGRHVERLCLVRSVQPALFRGRPL